MEVFIDLKSKITDPNGEAEEIGLSTGGNFAYRDNTFYISYDEEPSDGIPGSKIIIKATDDKVTLTRNGYVPTKLYIEKGKRHLCHYGTEFGQMLIGISAISIDCELNKGGGRLRFVYEIDINSDKCSKNEIDMKIREAM